ncbi:MAG: hypothetical protein NWE90_03845, partial [Candidatus Bathyarchaeota archaeon]|nr:hypothetical protein [Candidatus Bathyarchaeota archaeon]
RQRVLREIIRVTKPEDIIVIVGHALPENKIGRCLIYHFARSYESKYYPESKKERSESITHKIGNQNRKGSFHNAWGFKNLEGFSKMEKEPSSFWFYLFYSTHKRL